MVEQSVSGNPQPEAETATQNEPVTILDLLSTSEGADIVFEPERLHLTARAIEDLEPPGVPCVNPWE